MIASLKFSWYYVICNVSLWFVNLYKIHLIQLVLLNLKIMRNCCENKTHIHLSLNFSSKESNGMWRMCMYILNKIYDCDWNCFWKWLEAREKAILLSLCILKIGWYNAIQSRVKCEQDKIENDPFPKLTTDCVKRDLIKNINCFCWLLSTWFKYTLNMFVYFPNPSCWNFIEIFQANSWYFCIRIT